MATRTTNTQTIQMRVPYELLDLIDEHRGIATRTAFILDAVEARVEAPLSQTKTARALRDAAARARARKKAT